MLPRHEDIRNMQTGNRGTTIPSLAVLPEYAHRWQLALIRGQEHGLRVERRRSEEWDGVKLAAYVVSSYAVPGLLHPVMLAFDTNEGTVMSQCDCEAGTFAKPCQHAALAIDAEQWWPEGMGIHRQTQLVVVPSDAPVPEFRVGGWVKREGGKTLYCVADRRIVSGEWQYDLVTVAREPVGTVAESALVEATNKRRQVA